MKGFDKFKRRKGDRAIQATLTGFEGIDEPIKAQAGQGVIPLDFESHAVRMTLINGEPWWVLSDVARVLGYRDAEKADRLLRPKHKGTPLKGTPGLQPHQTLISEAGLYRLMMRSEKPEAERFQDWITEEILPSIRRTGSYQVLPDRVRQTMKRTNCDLETAVRRVENRDLNRRLNAKLYASREAPHPSVMHDAVYRGQFGQQAKGLREMVGIRPGATPLDRMSGLALVQNTHAKTLASKIIDQRAIEPKARAVVYELTASQIVAEDRAKLGGPHVFAAIDDPRRGKVIDLIPIPIAAQSSPNGPALGLAAGDGLGPG